MKRDTVTGMICYLIGGLFIYASVSKLLDHDQFKLQLSRSPFITNFSNFIPWFLPSAEIITALLLAIPALRLIGLYASLFLLSLFTAYLLAMLNFSYYIPCSCGGILSTLTWPQHIIFNLVFVALSVTAILINTPQTRNQKNRDQFIK